MMQDGRVCRNNDDKGLKGRCRGCDSRGEIGTFFCPCVALQENEW
jgi:hypothetical protein